jgi:hypothetical protein
MKKKAGIVIIGIIMVLVACSGSITGELYIRDLLDLADSPNQVYFTQGTLSIESLGSDNNEELKEMMTSWFREATNFREVSVDYSTYLVADIKIPVTHVNNEQIKKDEDLLSIIVKSDKSGELDFGVRFQKKAFAKIQQYLKSEYFQDISIQDWNFTIDLKNDTRESQTVILQTIYANDEPLLFPMSTSINERETIELSFPDILRDYGYAEGEVFFGKIIL